MKQSKMKINSKKITLHKLDWLEWIAIGLSMWFLFYPKPYNLLLLSLLLLPFIGMFLNGLNKPSIASLVEIDRNSKNEYDVADFIDIPAWAITIRVFIDYELDSYWGLIIIGSVAFIAVLFFLFITHKQIEDSNKDKLWIYLSIIFSIFIYSYSSIYAINCSFDNSVPKVYDSKIIDKHISRGRKGRKTYYVKVQPWGHHYESENMKVSRDEYESYYINESVKIDYKKGLLGISWYYLE